MREVEEYNSQATDLEQRLRELCPLIQWRVAHLYESLNPQPHEFTEFRIEQRYNVNGYLFRQTTLITKECLDRAAFDIVEYMVRSVAGGIAKAIVSWRPC